MKKMTMLVATVLALPSLLASCDVKEMLAHAGLPATAGQASEEASPADMVNALPYSIDDPTPARAAWVIVARSRGWADADIEAWTPFVMDVIMKESRGCPLIRRGAKMANGGVGCAIAKQGKHSDSGIGQVLGGYPNRAGWYRPVDGGTWKLHENATWLCPQEGLCSPDEIVASAWTSYTAFVATLERTWGAAWCYAGSRGYHKCRLRP